MSPTHSKPDPTASPHAGPAPEPVDGPVDGPVSGLAAEIGKASPFEVPEEELFLSLLRTTGWLNEGVTAVIREVGLSAPLYNILRILAGHAALTENAGRPFEGIAVSRIGEHMLTREPDMTRLIDRLEKLGHVERRRCPEDRRRVLVIATDTGRDLAKDLRPRLEAKHRDQLGHLSPAEQAALIDLLHKAREPMRSGSNDDSVSN